MSINQIGIEHIERLTDVQLTKLLHSLLRIELIKNEIDGSSFVPFNITTGDGGDDGRVKWENSKESTKWLKKRFCLFQNKATILGPTACYHELLKEIKEGEQLKLKPRIEELVNEDGCYVLFTNKSLNTELKEQRVVKFREAIRDAGFENYSTLKIEVYDSNSIKDWVNENIGTVTLVQSFNDITRPTGFRLWNQWERSLEGSDTPYQKNELIDQYIENIHDKLAQRKPIRIIGHSGLGKTRLVLEAFRPNEGQPNIKALKQQLVYYDLKVSGGLPLISNYVISHSDQDGIIVVDNCDEQSHRALSGLVNSMGKFRLITIDISTSTDEESTFKLNRENQRDIVKSIIDDKLGSTHGDNDRGFLNKLCEGYPWMAVRFCKNIKDKGIADFSNTLPKDFIKKLLFNLNEESVEYNVIRACSVFSTFGFLDDELRPILTKEHRESLESQMDFIRSRIYGEEISSRKFYEICKKYKAEDIIEQRGTQYIVKPTILAINLASDWLLSTPPDDIIEILGELKGSPLSTKFVERLKDLDQIDKAQNIVNELWGPESPFGSAEVLNTEWGSLLFRHIVDVNPAATAKALQKAFGKYSKEEVRGIKRGRRNLVWALEKLCFRKETFPIAAKVLYAFAVGENERIANNSEGQFNQLYQLFLSGTEADLKARLKIIKWGLSKKDDDYNRVAINALGKGLLNDHYSRMGGAEKQGSRAPLKDYKPNWKQIFEFWDESISILIGFACHENVNQGLAKIKLANAFRTLIRDGKVDEVLHAFKEISNNSDSYWREGLSALKKTVGLEKLPESHKEKILKVIEEFSPKDLKNLLLSKVKLPEWDSYEKDENGHYIDKPKLNAEAFADQLIKDNIDFAEYLSLLLTGEQRQAFNFGKRIGELIENKNAYLDKVFSALKTVDKAERNIDFIGGFVIGSNDESIKNKALETTLNDQSLNHFAFYLARITKPNLAGMEQLFAIIGEDKLPIRYFKNFQYGRALDHLHIDEVLQLCKKIAAYGKEGAWTALSVIYMYSRDNEARWKECQEFIRNLVTNDNLTIEISNAWNIDFYHWSDSVEKLLNDSSDIDLSKVIAKQLIEFSHVNNFNYSYEAYVKKVFRVLLDDYFEATWNIIGAGLISEYETCYHLKNILGARNGDWGRDGSLFENETRNEAILEWVRDHKNIAPISIANMMPIENTKSDTLAWHPFAKAIIDEFGDIEGVLNELSANMGTYSMTGSSVDYYKDQKALLEQLQDHHSETVNEWVEKMIEYTNKRIKLEKLDDEERFLH